MYFVDPLENEQVRGTTRCVSLQVMKSLRFARLGLHSFWEVDFTMCVCYCRLTLLGLLGFCELYFADLILSLLISSWLVCCVRFVVTRLLCFFNNLVDAPSLRHSAGRFPSSQLASVGRPS